MMMIKKPNTHFLTFRKHASVLANPDKKTTCEYLILNLMKRKTTTRSHLQRCHPLRLWIWPWKICRTWPGEREESKCLRGAHHKGLLRYLGHKQRDEHSHPQLRSNSGLTKCIHIQAYLNDFPLMLWTHCCGWRCCCWCCWRSCRL